MIYAKRGEYYETHKDNMTLMKRKIYEKYFNDKEKYFLSISSKVPYEIIADLIKENYDDYFFLRKSTEKDVTKLLKEHGDELTKKVKEQLLAIFSLDSRKFMTGKEINHVYRILYKLYVKRKKYENKDEVMTLILNNGKNK